MRKRAASAAEIASVGPKSLGKPPVASVVAEPSSNGQPASGEAIRLCAYQKWEVAGRPTGDGVKFWLEAERELSQAK
jgi:hypothetical protein